MSSPSAEERRKPQRHAPWRFRTLARRPGASLFETVRARRKRSLTPFFPKGFSLQLR
jgi:hypothetical protein